MLRHLQKRLACATLACAASLVVLPVAADEPTATLRCERASGPGRVRCAVEARPAAGRTIAWGDVAIVAVPEIASALRGRLGDESQTAHEPTLHGWDFALLAKSPGRGTLRARVRLVTCTADARCLPTQVEVTTELVVGG